ncbi:MAG: class I SAM-dependent methyltransferase [Phycisphaerae bacterium]|nr:class I SAM-dependent methyltransferase [Phycisphaerae bacterium]
MSDTSSTTWYWNRNTIILPEGGGLCRLFQPNYRRNILGPWRLAELSDLLLAEEGCTESVLAEWLSSKPLSICDATDFTLWASTVRNSDFLAEPKDRRWFEPGPAELIDLLREHHFIESQPEEPFDYEKRSFGDRFRGTFFEQIGTEALYHRVVPTEWWTKQKFADDGRSIRQTPYRYIEETFLDAYFAENFSNLDVLEIGSGTGYFTRKMACHARSAVGMDYNPDYIAQARDLYPPEENSNLAFEVGDILDLSKGSGNIHNRQFDRVILIDTFLFLFDPSYQPQLVENRGRVMQNIKKLLKPDGRLLIMDPHPFWLTPWIGGETHPVGILTEYRHRHFKVVPTLEEMTNLMCENGYRIVRILEPPIHPDYKTISPRAYAFMEQFPQWWFWELQAAS